VPIEGKTGADGGIWIYKDYCLEKGFLTDEERARLIACVNAMTPTFNDPMQELLVQKLIYNKKIAKDNIEILRTESVYIDISGWNNPHFYRKKLNIFNEAISNAIKVSFNYTDRYSARTFRTVHPYTLVLKEGAWYLFAYCETRKDYRLFRLSRISNILPLEDTFTKNTSINIVKHLNADFEDTPEISISIKFNNLVLQDIEEWLGTESITQSDLLYTAQAVVYSGQKLISKLMSFGSDVEVISPTHLRNELYMECNRLCNLYKEK